MCYRLTRVRRRLGDCVQVPARRLAVVSRFGPLGRCRETGASQTASRRSRPNPARHRDQACRRQVAAALRCRSLLFPRGGLPEPACPLAMPALHPIVRFHGLFCLYDRGRLQSARLPSATPAPDAEALAMKAGQADAQLTRQRAALVRPLAGPLDLKIRPGLGMPRRSGSTCRAGPLGRCPATWRHAEGSAALCGVSVMTFWGFLQAEEGRSCCRP